MSRNTSDKTSSWLTTYLHIITQLLALVLLLPLVVLFVAAYVFYGLFLHFLIWICWCTRGVNVMLVYSESPKWQDYIDQEILPRLPKSTVTLNWSQRSRWRWYSLPVIVFLLFGGYREYNPVVIVFRPFRWTKTFRFFKAFNDLKHGNPQTLETVCSNLFQHLEQSGIATEI